MIEIELYNKKYKGISDKNSLFWCHGLEGLKHEKVRKFRYPYWKYIDVDEIKIISCICLNCNMKFYGELAKDAPLSIPIKIDEDDFYSQHIQVKIKGKKQPLVGEVIYKNRLRGLPTELINYKTKDFIEKVQ